MFDRFNGPHIFQGHIGMTGLEVLDRDVSALKELLRVAWEHLANPLLSPFDRRETRNAIKQYSRELRQYLQALEAERTSRKQVLKEYVDRSFGKPTLRLFPGGL